VQCRRIKAAPQSPPCQLFSFLSPVLTKKGSARVQIGDVRIGGQPYGLLGFLKGAVVISQ
jgi:hypothetical protein